MRIPTADRYDATILNLQQRQVEMSRIQFQMTSGKRIAEPSDDPTGSARAERAYIAQQRIGSDQRSVGASRSAMTLAESALGQAGEVLQSARETLISAGNGSMSADERSALANQLRQLRGQLLAVANQGDGSGGYVFGGQGAQGQPFLDSIGGVSFAGTPGSTIVSNRDMMPISVDGQSIWLGARAGNGVFVTAAAATNSGSSWIDSGGVSDPAALTGHDYAVVFSVGSGGTTYSVLDNGNPTAVSGAAYRSGAAITVDGMDFHINGSPADGDRFTLTPSHANLGPFSVLDRAIAVLDNASANAGQVQQAVNDGVRDVDAVAGQMQAARSAAGAALNRLDQIDQRNQDAALWAKSEQSNAEDADMVQTVSEFQNQQSSYQAALQSYAMVQKLSLLDYIK